MRRRALIVGAIEATLAPATVWTQQRRTPKLDVLLFSDRGVVARFEEGLPKLGWEEGRNLELALRAAEGRPAVRDTLAANLVRDGVDVFVASQTSPVVAAQRTKPADLRLAQPTPFELIINMRAARALGLNLPANIGPRRRGDRMRRALFALLLALLPLVGARAQEKPFRVVVLTQANSPAIERIFIPELARQGVVHGRNAAVETRVVAAELLPDAARELAAEAPAAIFAISPPVVAAVAAATKTVPVVMMASNDPVRAGWVASLARPGGNVTGMLILGSELDPKRLEVLKELVPGARRVALVRDPATISSERWRQMEAAAAKLDVAVEDVEAARRDDIAPAFQRARERGVDAVSVLTSPLYSTEAPTVAAAAIAVGLPTICHWREMAEAGCLASYGPTFAETFSIAAAQIARILRGANPAEMPVEQPTRLELVINGRTARALGLTLPPAVLAGADEVME